MARIIIVGGWDEIIQEANKFFDNIILFQNNDSITEYQIKNVSELYLFDYTNLEKSLKLATLIHQKKALDGSISLTEFGLRTSGLINSSLGIKGSKLEPIDITQQKHKLREILIKNNIDKTKFKVCENFEEAKDFFKSLKSKVILKPIDSGGSIGVSSANSEESLKEAWEWSYSQSTGKIIIEEFIEGEEYSIETISSRGKHKVLGITKKLTTGEPNFVEVGHKFPFELPKKIQNKVEEKVFSLLNIIEYKDGPAHTEVKINNNDVFFIESQTRVGGDRIWELIQLSTGINLLKLSLKNILEPLNLSKLDVLKSKYSIINFYFDDKTLEKDLNNDTYTDYIHRHYIYKNQDEKISSLARKGYIIYTAESQEIAKYIFERN